MRTWGASIWIWVANKCGLSCCLASPFGGGRKAKEKKDIKTEFWFSRKGEPNQWEKTLKCKHSLKYRNPDISCLFEISAKWPGSS